jgi:hypothetical protein
MQLVPIGAYVSHAAQLMSLCIWLVRLSINNRSNQHTEIDMKKARLLSTLVAAGVLICSSQVMAQSAEIARKESGLAASFEQLKAWLFSERSNSTPNARVIYHSPDASQNASSIQRKSGRDPEPEPTRPPCCKAGGQE